MIKALDYYYLVLLRGAGVVGYKITTFMGLIFMINLFSFAILFDNHIIEKDIFWVSILVFGYVIMLILGIIYNKKRREKLIEEYKDESPESRQQGKVKVIVYEILSLAVLIFALLTLGK